ncbi:MAG: hypothetical protein EAY70_09430 [Sphingomonadales bacterium]|nr:MAG: hypothetical protein EAY70_09430 [Sphingomonadales bacterium]
MLTASLPAFALPLAARAPSSPFSLPSAAPAPTPAPAGPADERTGVTIAPRTQPDTTATAEPSPAPGANQPLAPLPAPAPAPTTGAARTSLQTREGGSEAGTRALPSPAATASPAAVPLAGTSDPSPVPNTVLPSVPAASAPSAPVDPAEGDAPDLLRWWQLGAGGLAALVLVGGGTLLWRRRKPKVLRLAAPVATPDKSAPAPEPPRLDLTLEVTSATRSVMLFTLDWRLTIANRSDRAVNDLALAVQLACARASVGNAPSAGSAQMVGTVKRIGPQQARSITGTVQLPLSAITPLRQGQTPLFVPLVHVTLEGEGQRVLARSFVIGTPSASGRVHPIPLDVPPGGINGLVAQAIAIPPAAA